MSVPLVLTAHGTRNPRGVALVHALAEQVRDRGIDARVAFVDVLGPTPAEVLREVPGPAVLVPAFLASGYHVRTDVPAGIAESGHTDVAVTAALGPDPVLAQVLVSRLAAAGHRPGDAVVLVAAGSSDPLALADVATAAELLAAALGDALSAPVEVGYVATAVPKVDEVVGRLRERGHDRVALAPYLLAPGLFHDKLASVGADVVAEPLGLDARVVDLVVARYRSALG
ncbi:sirohydrochlorin chelatase [Rhodococcus aerolatus]